MEYQPAEGHLIKGFVYSIQTKAELDNYPHEDVDVGVLVYVEETPKFYIYTGNAVEYWRDLGDGALEIGVFTNELPTPEKVGGIEKGETFLDVPYDDMFTKLLYPYQYPSFYTFEIREKSAVLEVGDTFTSPARFHWDLTNPDNVDLTSLQLFFNGEELTLTDAEKVASRTVEKIITPITKVIQTTVTGKIQANNTKNQRVERELTVEWDFRVYYGCSESPFLNESEIKSLSNFKLANNRKGTYQFTEHGYQYIAYPVAWGQPEKIMDDTGSGFVFALDDFKTIEITNDFAVTEQYYIIRSKNYLHTAVNMVVY